MHASHPLGSTWAFSEDDGEMAAQWRALEHLASDSLGRKVWELYQARGFAFSGTPGSAPPMLTQHDWVHVLADYGTTVEAEVEVFGLIARANDDMHAFSLAMVISLFETGYLESGAGLFEHSEGHFSSSPHMERRLADAMYRGAVCHDAETGHDSVDFPPSTGWPSPIAPAPTCEPDSIWCPSRPRRERPGRSVPGSPGVSASSSWPPAGHWPRRGGCPTTPTARRSEVRTRGSATPPAPPVVLFGYREVQLGEDVGHVLLDCALADDEGVGDGAVGAALGHEGEHLRSRGVRTDRESDRRVAPMSWVTTSGSKAVPPMATRSNALTKSATSATRSFSR